MRRRISAAGNSSGFTLIESLVALAILGVVVAVLVNVLLQTLRAEGFSRLHTGALLQAETILTGTMLGKEPQAIVEEAGKAGWRVTVERVGDEPGPAFNEWRVAASNPGAPAVSMMLHGVTNGGVPPPVSASGKGKQVDGDAGKTRETSNPAP